ncbi:MAG: Antitoxin VapB40 [Acidimicrobiales bacterium]|nr:MAG: AbrB/MazE/SpoVT family DNA-binding domain-containing protein [Actinomycetota bacterium]MBV6510154.1 Antitoxin VapB40 [Acidimicrobiales bacterium]RIK03812.1 MAG: antitoxin [Acidobacteriota bacterium]
MRTTIDGAGRIVIPKPLRDQLDLHAGRELEVVVRDGRLEVEVPPTEMRLDKRGGGVVAVPGESLPPLSVEQVRATLEQVRR